MRQGFRHTLRSEVWGLRLLTWDSLDLKSLPLFKVYGSRVAATTILHKKLRLALTVLLHVGG